MKIPQEVREAVRRFAGIEAIGGYFFRDDLEVISGFAVPLILSGAIPSQEVIDAIRILVDDADYDERESIGRAADTLHEWLDKIEQKEES